MCYLGHVNPAVKVDTGEYRFSPGILEIYYQIFTCSDTLMLDSTLDYIIMDSVNPDFTSGVNVKSLKSINSIWGMY